MSKQDDPTGWMWIHACEVIVKAERLQRQFFQPSASQRALAIWEPPVDVFEDEGEIVIVVAMPGVAPERVQVTHADRAWRAALVTLWLAPSRTAIGDPLRCFRASHPAAARAP